MRRSRRGGTSGVEFASSGEDSFVAVVVTKLTGALLFILLLTMVIMALLPKAVDLEKRDGAQRASAPADGLPPLEIATPSRLPEAVAGRPYLLALAATGGRGPLSWSTQGTLPDWLALDAASGRLAGTPSRPTETPMNLQIQVSDGTETATQVADLLVLPHQAPAEASWKSRLAAVPWRTWLEQGFGFLVLWLVHLLGMNLLTSIERGSLEPETAGSSDNAASMPPPFQKRFATYRLLLRLATFLAMAALALWLIFAPVRHS
jgi:hypothetical protein